MFKLLSFRLEYPERILVAISVLLIIALVTCICLERLAQLRCAAIGGRWEEDGGSTLVWTPIVVGDQTVVLQQVVPTYACTKGAP